MNSNATFKHGIPAYDVSTKREMHRVEGSGTAGGCHKRKTDRQGRSRADRTALKEQIVAIPQEDKEMEKATEDTHTYINIHIHVCTYIFNYI